MKNTMVALVLSVLALTAVSDVSAQTAPGNGSGWFVNGGVGRTSLKSGPYDGSDTGYTVSAGYRWNMLFPWLSVGLEAGYNDLGNIQAKNLFNSGAVVEDESQLRGWTVGVNQHFALGDKWYASMRGGLYGWKGQGLSNDTVSDRSDLDKLSWYAGAGVGYNLGEHFSVGVNYDHYNAKKFDVDLSTDMASMNAEYRF
ncbi:MULTISPECIES: porin family protein [Xanthomonas]|uniref:Porin family protein n=1 Tax=Xanthomonas dyei TaxID=743699 RepID=A0ABZ0DBU7_9XANT|nr:porin family protein [Xanthomonas dyei]WOB27282.1 porin family protein [Xanthomonas dyei]WOB54904.1 porin family protein [Xanthomonas dyei]